MQLSPAQLDRARGVLLGTAAGDALGAGYEFGPPLPDDAEVTMRGRGGSRPGEWTDDTSMAIAIAEVAARGADLRDAEAQDAIVRRWLEWAEEATDVGKQTRGVLAAVRGRDAPSAAARRAAADLHERTGHTAGNGSLMRTAPVALAHLDDEASLSQAARALSELTHFDPEAGEACVLWCAAIRHAVLTGALDVRPGLALLPAARRRVWARRLEDAERARPADYARNGWVVEALPAAWSAITATSTLPDGLAAAVRGGRDTDTVAAIAGGLLGAVHGAGAVPAQWRSLLHGWPGLDADGLVALAGAVAVAP